MKRNRDELGFNKGKSNKEKTTIITFVGFSVNRGRVQPKIWFDDIKNNQSAVVHYQMYSDTSRTPVLPLSNRKLSKKLTKELQIDPSTSQLDIQKQVLHLDQMLEVGKHYCVHQTNINELVSYKGDKAGKWIWDKLIPLNDLQAQHLTDYKKTLPDIDATLDDKLIAMIGAFGPHDGWHIYELGTRLYGPEPTDVQWIMTRQKFVEDKTKSYKQILTEQFLSF